MDQENDLADLMAGATVQPVACDGSTGPGMYTLWARTISSAESVQCACRPPVFADQVEAVAELRRCARKVRVFLRPEVQRVRRTLALPHGRLVGPRSFLFGLSGAGYACEPLFVFKQRIAWFSRKKAWAGRGLRWRAVWVPVQRHGHGRRQRRPRMISRKRRKAGRAWVGAEAPGGRECSGRAAASSSGADGFQLSF